MVPPVSWCPLTSETEPTQLVRAFWLFGLFLRRSRESQQRSEGPTWESGNLSQPRRGSGVVVVIITALMGPTRYRLAVFGAN